MTMTMTTTRATHAVVRTAFHGGGVVSRHRSEEAALRSVRRYWGTCGCACGCVCVVPIEDLDQLPSVADAGHPSHPAIDR